MEENLIQQTALHDTHVALGARMVPFAGYAMPVQYKDGIIAEHQWTRQHAGLFDVSHMGQATLRGPNFAATANALETLVPADVLGLNPLQQRYAQLLNETGGIIDDLMVIRGRKDGEIYLIVNAGRKDIDYAWIGARLPAGITIRIRTDLALMALQGPAAEFALAQHAPEIRHMDFMQAAEVKLGGIDTFITRSGYTGEDGFEISVFDRDAVALWNMLSQHPEIKPIGLGARDSLRLEAGLCLYGHDIDEATSPIEAGLTWSIGKRRRVEGGFLGAHRILAELDSGTTRKRVGIQPEGRAPAREGTTIHDATGALIGRVTSGGFGPSLNRPLAMGYVETAFAKPGTGVQLMVRDKLMSASVVALPFVPNRFKR